MRGYCKKDKNPHVVYKGEKKNWQDLFDNRRFTNFQCFLDDGEPICGNDSTHLGFYFVCHGPLDRSKWKAKELGDNHHDLDRKECKSFSFCGHSSVVLFNYVVNNRQQFQCCKTMKNEEKIMIKFTGCEHCFSIEGVKRALDEHDIKTLLVRNTNENKKYFGEYFISCPAPRMKCEGVMAVYGLKACHNIK